MGTLTFEGTGGVIEGNLGAANLNVNLDKSLMFDGTNDFVQCGTDTDHDFTDHFTLACWAKNDNAVTAGSPDREHLIAKYEGNNDRRLYRLYVLNTTLRFGVGYNSGNSAIEITYNISGLLDKWNHYAATFDGGVMKLYVNGVLVTNTDNSGTLTAIHTNNAIELNLGAYQNGSHTWTGQIADARIYNAVLTDANIQLLASKINTDSSLGAGTTNLKGYWKLNNETASGGGSGTGFIVDESGTVNQGTLTNFSGTYWDYDAYSVDVYDNSTTTDGTFTVTQGKVEGKALSSALFDGNADYIDCGTTVGTSMGNNCNNFSIAMWVKPDTHSDNDGLFTIGDFAGTNGEYSLSFNSGRLYSRMNNNNHFKYFTYADNDVWAHVAVVFDGDAGIHKLFYNGVEQTTTDSGGVPAGSNIDFASLKGIIGAYFSSSYGYDGDLNDVRLYDITLSNEQVASLYSKTLPITPKHWWKMDEGTGSTANDVGTGTTANGSLNGNAALSDSNGTLDLDGSLTIAANGTLSAPRGNMTLAGTTAAMDNSGTFTHNSGTVTLDNGADVAQKINDTGSVDPVFYNLTHNRAANSYHMYLEEDTTVENLFTNTAGFMNLRTNKTLTLGTDTSQGTYTAGWSGGGIRPAGTSTGNPVHVHGKNVLFPAIMASGSGDPIDWNNEAPDTEINIKFIDYRRDTTTGGSGTKVTLDGDCEFDAFTVSGGDTLDLNGQRAVFSGDVNPLGTFNMTNSLVFMGTRFSGAGTGTVTKTGSTVVFENTSSKTNLGDSNGVEFHNCFINNTSGTMDFINDWDCSGFLTVGAGDFKAEDSNDGNNNINAQDVTIATGGTLTMESSTLTCSGDFTTSGGLLGASCLSLDRDNTEYAQIPYHADLNLFNSRDAMTAECWFKTSYTGSNHQHIINLSDTDSNPIVLQVYIDYSTGKINGRIYTSGTTSAQIGASDVRDGKWHHLAMVYDGDTDKHSLYVDGKLESEETASGAVDAATDAEFTIGARRSLDQGYFEGEIDEVRLFAAAKTAAQIRADMFKDVGTSLTHFNSAADGSTDGLVGRWGCNEGTGSALSCSNSNLNGVIYDYNGGSPAAYTDAWAAGGTYTRGTSTLVMSKSGTQTITSLSGTFFENLTVSDGSTTQLHTLGQTGGNLNIAGNFIINEKIKPHASTPNTFLGFYVGDKTITITEPTTGIAEIVKLAFNHTSGTLTLPFCYLQTLDCAGNGGTTVQSSTLRSTAELQVRNGHTYNSSAATLEFKVIDLHDGSTVDLSGSLIEQKPASSDGAITFGSTSVITMGNKSGRGVAIIGNDTGGENTAVNMPAAGDYFMFGGGQGGKNTMEKCHMASGSDVTVQGTTLGITFADSTANVHQFIQNIDTKHMLDVDPTDDDDLSLPRPTLDNSLQLTGGD